MYSPVSFRQCNVSYVRQWNQRIRSMHCDICTLHLPAPCFTDWEYKTHHMQIDIIKSLDEQVGGERDVIYKKGTGRFCMWERVSTRAQFENKNHVGKEWSLSVFGDNVIFWLTQQTVYASYSPEPTHQGRWEFSVVLSHRLGNCIAWNIRWLDSAKLVTQQNVICMLSAKSALSQIEAAGALYLVAIIA